ncbi:MAG TPA: FHA domain-containing protein [Burkholderiales bacterium]|nr:FHA domain-containing protein [Burkholderiales bacterium]
MAKLILSMDGLVLKEIPLAKERTTIGRKPSNDVQIDNLAVSGEHAVIVTILNDSFLEDLGSTNGTLVNGNLVKKHFLQSNDVIELAKYKLKYVNEQSAQASAEDYEKTMVIRAPAKPKAPEPMPAPANLQATQQQALDTVPGAAKAPEAKETKPTAPEAKPAESKSADPKPAEAKPVEAKPAELKLAEPKPAPAAAKPVEPLKPAPEFKPAPAAAPATPSKPVQLATIQILTGPSAGKELDLTKSLTTLGKPGVQVAVITRRPQGYFITHVEGVSFPVVNGKTLDAQAHPLNDHNIIELGGVKMEFFYKTA